MLGAVLLSAINLAYYQQLTADARQAIVEKPVPGISRGNGRRVDAWRPSATLKIAR